VVLVQFLPQRASPVNSSLPGLHYRKQGFIRRFFKFVGTDEYIKIIFVGLDQAPMNIWVVRFDFDLPIYLSVQACHRRIYVECRAAATGPPIFVG
jgi:hypothetical protein